MKKKYNYEEYIGKTFGWLTVLNVVYQAGHGKERRFLVKCSNCGSEKLLPPHRLFSGHVKSCGCKQYIGFEKHNEKTRDDLTGEKIGHLLVLRKDSNHKPRHIKWICKCDCGVEKSILAVYLKNKIIKSCGCQQFQQNEKHGAWKGHGEIPGKLWSCIKRGADDREIEFKLTIEDAWNLFLKQNRKCAITGVNLYFYQRDRWHFDGNASLDRIDSNGCYELSNVAWVTKTVNIMKNKFSISEFINFCKLAVENNTLLPSEDYSI